MTKMTLVRNLREEEFILVHGSPRCQSMVAWPHVFGLNIMVVEGSSVPYGRKEAKREEKTR
jgi:hypothetical protein